LFGRETISSHDFNDPLEQCLLNNSTTKDENPKVVICPQFLEASPQAPPTLAKVETLIIDEKSSYDEERAPDVELKPFPPSLRYDCLGSNSTYLMIVNASISASQVDCLLRILRMNCKAIGYTLDDLKMNSPF